jgi:hypothetical protein
MELNKDTRNLVQEGTILKCYDTRYEVVVRIETQHGATVGLRNIETKQRIYGKPLATCYGMEIEKATGYKHYMIEGVDKNGEEWMFYASDNHTEAVQIYNGIVLPSNYEKVQLVGTNEDIDTYLTAEVICTRPR